ncbi:hypothetical protein [Helicobacter canis]|uniref:hypothetical protein n=1 Tax=Helicobacter canis TaxID=29419 RepID=UPI0026EA6918|nr:hypothetical protein [Helicobacter canis]
MNHILTDINTKSEGGLKAFSYGQIVADTREKEELVETLEQLLQKDYIQCKISSNRAGSGYLVYVIAEVCITQKGKEFLANNPARFYYGLPRGQVRSQ